MDHNKSLISLKGQPVDDVFQVEFEVGSIFDFDKNGDELQQKIRAEIYSIEEKEQLLKSRIDELSEDIDQLTNHADGLDYTIAVASGIISGFVDSFYVGEFNFDELKGDSHKHVNQFIEKYAKLRGYEDNGKGLNGAISFLEKKFPVAQDNVWKGQGFSSTRLHHLDDIAHHPTPAGLLASILVYFLRCSFFVDKNGNWHVETIKTDKKEMARILLPIIISGVLRWLVYMAESKYTEQNHKDIPKPLHKLIVLISQSPAIIEVLKVADNWFGHIVSDMGGSKNTAGGGMGVAGIFISLLKEISSLPGINNTKLPQLVSDLYSKSKIDLRTEVAILEFVGKQSVPVLLNECLVRTFYFVRHLCQEHKAKGSWSEVDWNNVKPWGNRTIARMITIASGTFTACDLADATIRSGVKNGFNVQNPLFWKDLVLRINFVGIGRMAVAIGNDVGMGVKKEKEQNERIQLQMERILLMSSGLYYKLADTWIEIQKTQKSIEDLCKIANEAYDYYTEWMEDISKSLVSISASLRGALQKNPTLISLIDEGLN